MEGHPAAPSGEGLSKPRGRKDTAWLWCVLGMMASLLVPVFASIPAAYGYGRIAGGEGRGLSRRGMGYLVLGMAATLAVGVPLLGVESALDIVAEQLNILLVVALVTVALFSRRRASLLLSATTLASGALLSLVMVLETRLVGTTPAELFTNMVQCANTSGLTLLQRSQISSMESVLPMLWPSTCLVAALVFVACAHAAAYAGIRAAGKEAGREVQGAGWSFSEFSLPFWTLAFVLAGLACLAGGTCLAVGNPVLVAVGANLLLCMRVAYVVQGFALTRWLCEKYEVGYFLRACLILLGLYLESSFYVVCVMGLVDALADFRQLGHGISRGADQSRS
jgi:hypothetical protein